MPPDPIHRNVTGPVGVSLDDTPFVPTKPPLINDGVFPILDNTLTLLMFSISSLFGITVNVFNIIVFKRQGLQESVTLGFFALSVSDLILVACPLGVVACQLANILFPDHPVHFQGIHFVSTGNVREMAYFFSNALTAMLSIERCCCVVLPFRVKGLFTVKKTRAAVIVLLTLIVVAYSPEYSTVRLRWMLGPEANDSSKTLTLWFAPYRKEVYAYSYYITGVAAPSLSLFVVICTTFIMVHGLRASSEFRQQATSTATTISSSSSSSSTTGISKKVSATTTLSTRDARLVKVMIFIGAILTVCNFPYVIFVCAMFAEPELDFGYAYHNTYMIVYNSCYLLSSVNSSANVFVYYKNSTRYRQIFDETFGSLICCRKSSK